MNQAHPSPLSLYWFTQEDIDARRMPPPSVPPRDPGSVRVTRAKSKQANSDDQAKEQTLPEREHGGTKHPELSRLNIDTGTKGQVKRSVSPHQ